MSASSGQCSPAKAALFVILFAVSTSASLGERVTLALRFTSSGRCGFRVAFSDPSFATFQASPGSHGSRFVWTSAFAVRVAFQFSVAAAVILGLLIAWAETGGWDPSSLRSVHQTSYEVRGYDPLFDKDIGFYPLLATGLRRGQETCCCGSSPAGCADGRGNIFPARRHQSRSSPLALLVVRNRPWLRAARSLFRS